MNSDRCGSPLSEGLEQVGFHWLLQDHVTPNCAMPHAMKSDEIKALISALLNRGNFIFFIFQLELFTALFRCFFTFMSPACRDDRDELDVCHNSTDFLH